MTNSILRQNKETNHEKGKREFSAPTIIYGFIVGLLVSWLASYHETMCGILGLQSGAPEFFGYAICYAYSSGCATGAAAFFLIYRKHPMNISKRFLLLAILGISILSIVNYAALEIGLYIVCTISVFLSDCIGSAVAITLIMGASSLESKNQRLCLSIALLVFFLCDTVLLPIMANATASYRYMALAQFSMIAFIVLLLYIPSGGRDFLITLNQGLRKATNPQQKPDGIAKPFAWQPLVSLGIFFFLYGVMHSESYWLMHRFFDRSLPYSCGALLAVLICFIALVALHRPPKIWDFICSVPFPLAMTSFLLLPALHGAASFVPIALTEAGYLIYYILVILACLKIAEQGISSLFFILTLTAIVLNVSFLAGSLLYNIQVFILPLDVLYSPYSPVVVFFMLIFATNGLGREHSVRNLWGMRVRLSPQAARENDIRECVCKISEQFNFTPKECEIAVLLALGRNITDISDESYISVATTRTHIRNFYAKANVHSRRDFDHLVKAELG